jgi:hypothetical protein
MQINDVDVVAGRVDETLHLGVPALALVPKVDPRFQKFFHGYYRHVLLLFA